MDPVAGEVAHSCRSAVIRRVLAGAACLLPAACAEIEQAANPMVSAERPDGSAMRAFSSAAAWLVPQPPLLGGTLADSDDRSGTRRSGARGGYFKLARPTAVSVWGPDVYVVDSATSALYRFDSTTQTVTRLAAVRALIGTRVLAGPDGSVYLLQPGVAGISRYARDGRLIATYAAPGDLIYPVDMVIEPARGLLWVADGSLEQIVAFHPMGRIAYVVGHRGSPDHRLDAGMRQMAAGERSVFVTDPACRCVGEVLPGGQGLRTFGEGELIRPTAVAADRWGRVWVVDTGDRRIKVFFDGLPAGSVRFAELSLASAEAMTIHENDLYLADGQGARIAIFRITAPAAAAARP